MRIGVVIVVELFATEPDGDWRDVPALVLHAEIPVSNGMSHSVDDSSSPERNPDHLCAPDKRPDKKSEQIDIDTKHQEDSERVATSKDVTFEPVTRSALSVLLENAWLSDSLSIVKSSLQHDVAETFHQRAVRISFTIGKCVVLAMAGDP